MSRRVVVAMSGGVDSSVAAAILREQGYDVIGMAMRLAPDASPHAGGGGSCCSAEDFEDARRVAELMGFPFYVIDLRQEFKRTVIDYFVKEYSSGRTPNPCAMCNREVKFDRLWERALALEADYVATGHYARVARDAKGGWRLWRARDAWKDQSYFLFNLSSDDLARTLFPLGDMTKQEVRQRARQLGLRNADKTESQEICFVQASDYADFVAARVESGAVGAGAIVDTAGRELGRHEGIHRFTVGQRRGLGIASAEALFVREIRAANREVVAVPKRQLLAKGLFASQVRMVNPLLAGQADLSVQVKIRSRHPGIAATLSTFAAGCGGLRAEVKFLAEFPAVTPGQACVFYDGNEVLGGGFIDAPMAVS
ncbi:MAG TPA: tRNA 2-thiouridine(34) synthase MnmA [Candidatus Binataceae bacterium]